MGPGVSPSRRPDVAAEALLGRSAIAVGDDVAGYLAGATVFVTGAAGSIGSALCVRLAALGVGDLVAVDAAEAPLVELATTLRYDHGFSSATPVLADVRSGARMAALLATHRPSVVFHAAAYKQVPLLEAHPVEAAATNVLGTRCVVEAAVAAGVERFVLFSSDKAVHPTGILGRTKAVAEWIVANAGREARASFAAIRLVNVVDSAGSIVPLFRRQVARGGPVTVTDADATRYLMTIDEAVGLAIAAGALAESGGTFWLDVGPPVRILDVARRVAGEVPIAFVGLRPGDRLHEQLWWRREDVTCTPCEFVRRETIRAVDPGSLGSSLDGLEREVVSASGDGVSALLAEMQTLPNREEVLV